MLYKNNVSIIGHVFNPGNKEFFTGMTLFDLLFAGGGFKNEEHLSNTFFDRADLVRIKKDKKSSEIIPFRVDSVLAGKGLSRLELKMGDKVKIYSLENVKGLSEEQ